MIRLPAPRLLPVTIIVTAILLGLKSLSLGHAAFASDPAPGAQVGSQVRSPETPAIRSGTGSVAATASTAPAKAPSSAPPAAISTPLSLPPDWQLLQELRDRRHSLDLREHTLDLRDAALQAAAETLRRKLTDLRSLTSQLEALEAAREKRSDAGWTRLVKLYEAMRPDDAATIFNALDVHLLVQILDRMNERKAALVMGNMEPDRARLATQLLALYRQRQDADPITAAAPPKPSRSPGAG